MSNPVGDKGNGDPKWANWSMGADWLSRHLWEHYLYTAVPDLYISTLRRNTANRYTPDRKGIFFNMEALYISYRNMCILPMTVKGIYIELSQ